MKTVKNENSLIFKGVEYIAQDAGDAAIIMGHAYGPCEGCALENTADHESMRCPTVPHCCADFRQDKRNIIWVKK
jgi:hypothetical protein